MSKRPRLYVNGALTVSGAVGQDAASLLDEYAGWMGNLARTDATHATAECPHADCDVNDTDSPHTHHIEVRA